MRHFQRQLLIIGCLITFPILLVLPQYFSGGVILGPDFLFHYNRFYDTAMQIKTGNFNYFISTYGFQQSGRIVNALYGPFFAYFQGLLVLFSKTWYNYQIISRLVLNLIASFSMYALLRVSHVRIRLAVLISCLYLTTFAILDWTIRQNLTSWGAAISPFALIPAFRYAANHELSVIKLAISVAILLQVHVLSAVILVIAYLPFFTYGLLTSTTLKKDLIKVAAAIFLFFLLTLNVWTALLAIFHSNNLILPFTNHRMYAYSITEIGSYWLFFSVSLLVAIIVLLFVTIKKWHSANPFIKICIIEFWTFLIISSSVFPWYLVTKYKIQMLEIFQFPFRFFVMVTIFTCVLVGSFLSQAPTPKYRQVCKLVLIITLAAFFQTTGLLTNEYKHWNDCQHPIKKLNTLVFNSKNDQAIHDSFYSTNLNALLKLVQKKTPDYLPEYQKNVKKTYRKYAQYIIYPSKRFVKTIIHNKLVITWYANKKSFINVPVVKYAGTKLVFNGKTLAKKHQQYRLTKIGTPILSQKIGENKLVVSYTIGKWFLPILFITIFSWSFCLAFWGLSWLLSAIENAQADS
ncbi:hypothetical protein [Liquorilactobacillus sicerae]|uniref:hypothetical protein n=1 Tax=Liquorilactobacillus sicerae TaxID=1416943 RepID=UPI0024814AD1|nr:hypothetical protein [Liquorilactobacillus sicerae]